MGLLRTYGQRESQHKHHQPEITGCGWTAWRGEKHQPLGGGLAESLVVKGKMLQEIWGSVRPAARRQVPMVIGGNEPQRRKECDLGGSGRLIFV